MVLNWLNSFVCIMSNASSIMALNAGFLSCGCELNRVDESCDHALDLKGFASSNNSRWQLPAFLCCRLVLFGKVIIIMIMTYAYIKHFMEPKMTLSFNLCFRNTSLHIIAWCCCAVIEICGKVTGLGCSRLCGCAVVGPITVCSDYRTFRTGRLLTVQFAGL